MQFYTLNRSCCLLVIPPKSEGERSSLLSPVVDQSRKRSICNYLSFDRLVFSCMFWCQCCIFHDEENPKLVFIGAFNDSKNFKNCGRSEWFVRCRLWRMLIRNCKYFYWNSDHHSDNQGYNYRMIVQCFTHIYIYML